MSDSRTELGARLRAIRERIVADKETFHTVDEDDCDALLEQLRYEREGHARQVAELSLEVLRYLDLRRAALDVVEVWDSWHYCPGDGGALQAAVRKLRAVLNADTERPGDGTDRS